MCFNKEKKKNKNRNTKKMSQIIYIDDDAPNTKANII